uniref:MD-2-related lipid-recognition domain-containing protein n=1 Tax=Anopheles culicifacies TaxID=139723 RepID=A0A182LSF9_9DIPT
MIEGSFNGPRLRGRQLFILCLTHFTVPVSFAGYKVTPFLTKVDVTNYSNHLNLTVHIASTSNENRINLEINTLHKVPNPRIIVVIWIHVGPGAALQTLFYNQTIDICTFIKNPGTHRLVLVVYREMRRHGSIPTDCPVPSGSYMFTGISTNQMRFPSFFTQTNFRLDITGLIGPSKVRILDSRWYGVINKVKCTAADRC